MPQGPIQTIDFTDGTKTAFNINVATVVKIGAGMLAQVQVVTAGSTTPGNIYDSASTANCNTGNVISELPNTVGAISLGFPCATGITVQPGSGQMVTVIYR